MTFLLPHIQKLNTNFGMYSRKINATGQTGRLKLYKIKKAYSAFHPEHASHPKLTQMVVNMFIQQIIPFLRCNHSK
jgi:hypothetical protein